MGLCASERLTLSPPESSAERRAGEVRPELFQGPVPPHLYGAKATQHSRSRVSYASIDADQESG